MGKKTGGKPYTPAQENEITTILMQLVTGFSAEKIAEIAGKKTIVQAYEEKRYVPYYKYPSMMIRVTNLLALIDEIGLKMDLPAILNMLRDLANTAPDMGPLDFTGEYPPLLRMDALRGNPHMMHTRVMGIGTPIGMPIMMGIPPSLAEKMFSPEVVRYLQRDDVQRIEVIDGKATAYKADESIVTLDNDAPSSETPSNSAPSDEPIPFTDSDTNPDPDPNPDEEPS
jgi:hypothetical protein